MRPETGDAAYLWDMLDAARAVAGFVRDQTLEDYRQNRMLRGAVERHIEIIGEAAKSVSGSFRTNHPQIPWKKIIAQRHVLAHAYGDIKHERVWDVANVHIPELILLLEPLVPPAPDGVED